MAEEEDFSLLPLPDRFTHKVRSQISSKTLCAMLIFHRIGKFERRATKMQLKRSRQPQMNQILLLDLLRWTRDYGEVPYWIRMSQRNRRGSMPCVLS